MTSREIVQRTVDFTGPERVARFFGDSDFLHVRSTPQTHASEWRETRGGRWERTDEWGNTWGRIDPTSKGEVLRGVLDNLEAITHYRFPDFSRPEDYEAVREARMQYPDRWLVGVVPGFAFNIARKMRRLDHYLADLVLEPERLHAFHDQIDEMLEPMIRNYAEAGADCIMFAEDWGTQNQTLISPALWHEEFQPRFFKLCGLAHSLGIQVFMHSCGKIGAIIPGLIDAGIDLLQFDQPDLHGIDTLASYQDQARITFWCPVDIQKTLQCRDEQRIRAKAREMLDKLWFPKNGGFVAGFYTDEASIGLDPKWQAIACDEFMCHGVRT